MLTLDFAELRFQGGTELLANIKPQTIDEEHTSAGRHIG